MAGLIVQEWLAPRGGSERVVEQFVATFPDADLAVLWNDDPSTFPRARESWMAATPLRRSKAVALPFMLPTWRRIKPARPYEWLLVSSHLFAHHARVRGQTEIPKLVYAHTPARYIWEPGLDTRGNSKLARIAASVLKPIDKQRARESASIVANSEFTKQRIERTWGRQSTVIYPPVATEEIIAGGEWATHLEASEAAQLDVLPDVFLLGASRFVPYKRLDLVIRAGEASGIPVVLAGEGPEYGRLREYGEAAGVPVFFVRSPSTTLLYALFQRSLAYVFPAIEDFGIMPVEAMAAGAPVVVPSVGGAAESVIKVQGGVAVDDFTSIRDLREAVFSAAALRLPSLSDRTNQFSATRFRGEIRRWVEGNIERTTGGRD